MIDSNQNILPNTSENSDLISVFKELYKKKASIFVFTSFIALCSIIFSLWMPNIYTSEAVLLVRDEDDNSIQGQSQSFTGLQAFSGLNFKGGAEELSKRANEGIYIVRSRKFYQMMVDKYNYLPQLLASKSFDSESNQIKFSASYDNLTSKWKDGKKPSYEEGFREYSKIISLKLDVKTGFLILKVSHVSPYFAQELALNIIDEVNARMLDSETSDAEKSLAYLNEISKKPNYSETKSAIAKLIERKLNVLMVSSINKDYVFKYIDPPSLSLIKTGPARAIIVLISTAAAFIFSCIFVLALPYFRK